MMNFAADQSAFLADFGQDFAKAGGGTFRAILDQPDDVVNAGGVGSVSRQYQLTYATNDATLTRDDIVTSCGANYKLREPPMQIDDGAFTQVMVSRQP
jgi:hypothetical protein